MTFGALLRAGRTGRLEASAKGADSIGYIGAPDIQKSVEGMADIEAL
jgi:hypothetical protein